MYYLNVCLILAWALEQKPDGNVSLKHSSNILEMLLRLLLHLQLYLENSTEALGDEPIAVGMRCFYVRSFRPMSLEGKWSGAKQLLKLGTKQEE